MQPKQNLAKKIIITLTILVVILGIFFGIKFYNASKETPGTKNTRNSGGSVPFQTRTGSNTGDVTVTNSTQDPTEQPATSTTTTSPGEAPRLVQLWKAPASGFDFIYKDVELFATTSTSTVASTTVATTSTSSKTKVAKVTAPKNIILKNQEFIYVWDRATGNIFQNLASTSLITRLSNNTLPRIEEAYFIDGFNVLVRGLDRDNESIITKYITLSKGTATSTTVSAYENFVYLYAKQIALLADSKKMFYFTEKTGQGIISNVDGGSITKTIRTTLTEWLSQYVNKNTVAVTTKPSAYFPGYLFFVNTNGSGNNTYIFGEKYGLTTLVSPDGKKVLYSEIRNNQLETVIYDVRTKKEIVLTQSTLSEKCVWTADSTTIYCAIPQKLALAPYPDAWYQNETFFDDNIWSISPTTGEFILAIKLRGNTPESIDAYNLKVSKNKKYLLFQDRYSLTVWKYNF